MQLLNKVIMSNVQVRVELSNTYRAIERLFRILVTRFVPTTTKGTIINTIATFATTPDLGAKVCIM